MEPREHRLQVQPLERRELGAFDDGEVLTAVRSYLCVGLPVTTGQRILDVHPRKVVLDVRRERRVEVQAREVTVGVVDLVVRDGRERLATGAGHGQNRDERQETVLAGQIELRIDPLDLEEARHVGVDIQAASGAEMAASVEAARLTAIVAGKATVVGPALAVHQIELDAEHGLRPPDRELEVRADASPGVPFTIAVARVVAVVEVPAHRGDLIEESGDRHLRRRHLGARGRRQREKGQEGDECKDQSFPHHGPPKTDARGTSVQTTPSAICMVSGHGRAVRGQ